MRARAAGVISADRRRKPRCGGTFARYPAVAAPADEARSRLGDPAAPPVTATMGIRRDRLEIGGSATPAERARLVGASDRSGREGSRSAISTGAAQPRTGPPEQRLADRLTARQMGAPTSARATAVAVLGEVGQVDLAVYRAIAGSPTPILDRPMRRLSAAANWSRLWIVVGGAMAVVGGRAGRRAAGAGLVALAVDSAVVNIGLKVAARRRRPDRDSAGVPTVRRVPMRRRRPSPQGIPHPALPSRTRSRTPCPRPPGRWACSPAPSVTPASTPACIIQVT